jgi:hypothetical protein
MFHTKIKIKSENKKKFHDFFYFLFIFYYYNLLSKKYIGFLCDSMLNLQINLRLYNSKNIILSAKIQYGR